MCVCVPFSHSRTHSLSLSSLAIGKDREASGREPQSAIDLVFGSDMRRRETVLAGQGQGQDEGGNGSNGSQQVSREFQWRLTYPKTPPGSGLGGAAAVPGGGAAAGLVQCQKSPVKDDV